MNETRAKPTAASDTNEANDRKKRLARLLSNRASLTLVKICDTLRFIAANETSAEVKTSGANASPVLSEQDEKQLSL
jgi:hypothetical protein